MNKLFMIEANYFGCGIEVSNSDMVVRAAPIVDYFTGWTLEEVKKYCIKRNWTIREITVAVA